MTADREREGIDRLRVGGWLPPARKRAGRDLPPAEAVRAGPAHAAPDDDEVESPVPYEAPRVDLDEPVPSLTPHRRAAPHRSRTFDTGPGVVANVGRYVYQGRRHIGEMMARAPHRQRTRLALAGITVLALAVLAVATLSPDGDKAGAGQGLALQTGAPQLPPPGADQEIGSASPSAPASPRTTPPRTKTAPPPPPRTSRPGPLTLKYEAEAAVLVGGAAVTSLPQASGGRIVHNIGSQPGQRPGLVSFTEVDVPSTNRYALTVEYVTDQDRTAVLTINGDTSIRLSFPSSGGWSEVASRTFTITLVGGRNNLTFSNPNAWAPRLDRIFLLG